MRVYVIVNRMTGKVLSKEPFTRFVDAFNAARAMGPLAMVRSL